MSNTETLSALYAAMDGLLADLDANGSAEMAANSLRYHLKENGLAIRAAQPLRGATLPPEALEWARQLVEQGYRDEHIVTFTEDGYGLEHPIRCRPNLTGCNLNEWLRTQMAPDREPGRYVMEWTDDGPEYVRLGGEAGEHSARAREEAT